MSEEHPARAVSKKSIAAVKAKRKGAYEQALKAVDQRPGGALDVAKRFMNPLRGLTARSAADVLNVALIEY